MPSPKSSTNASSFYTCLSNGSSNGEPKGLHKASCLKELNELVVPNESCCKISRTNCLLAVRKIFGSANRALAEGDEENAYVLFMRMVYLYKERILKNSDGINADDSFLSDVSQMSREAIEKANELSNRLQERYGRKRNASQSLGLSQPPDISVHHKFARPIKSSIDDNEETREEKWIDSKELNLLLTRDPKTVMLIQVRTAKEVADSTFSASHGNVICVDLDTLSKAGTEKPSFKQLCDMILDDRERRVIESNIRKFQHLVILESSDPTKSSEIVRSTILHRLPPKVGLLQRVPRILRGGFLEYHISFPYKCIGRPPLAFKVTNGETTEIPKFPTVEQNEDFDADQSFSNVENRILSSISPPTRPARNRNSSSIPAPVGIPNYGNTCFLNSAVQCLASVKPICEYFLSGEYLSDLRTSNELKSNGNLSKLFAELLAHIRPHYDFPVRRTRSDITLRFRNLVAELFPAYGSGDQEDAFEVLLVLVNGFHAELNKATKAKRPELTDAIRANPMKMWSYQHGSDDSFIVNCLYGLIEYTTTCSECQNKIVSYEIFANLTLQIQNMSNLKECLEKSFGEEEMEVACSQCKQTTRATRNQRLHSLPPVLLILLSRYCVNDGHLFKINHLIYFSTDMLIVPGHLIVNNRPATYQLVSVCNHSGFLFGGHYTANCRQPDGTWYLCNDSNVVRVNPNSVVTSGAYALVYRAKFDSDDN